MVDSVCSSGSSAFVVSSNSSASSGATDSVKKDPQAVRDERQKLLEQLDLGAISPQEVDQAMQQLGFRTLRSGDGDGGQHQHQHHRHGGSGGGFGPRKKIQDALNSGQIDQATADKLNSDLAA